MGPGRRKVHVVRALGLGGVAQEDAKGDAAPLMANRLTTGNLSAGKPGWTAVGFGTTASHRTRDRVSPVHGKLPWHDHSRTSMSPAFTGSNAGRPLASARHTSSHKEPEPMDSAFVVDVITQG